MDRIKHGVKVRFEIFKRDRFCCVYCGVDGRMTRLVLDHRVPLARGGLDIPENLVTACEPCNSGKGARPLDEADLPPMEVQIRILGKSIVYDWPTDEEQRAVWECGILLDDHRLRLGGTIAEPLTRMEVALHVHCSGALPPSPRYMDTLPPERPYVPPAPSPVDASIPSLFGPPRVRDAAVRAATK